MVRCLEARASMMYFDLYHIKGLSKSHFSLSEEARNTERHRPWNSDLKLRHSRISFVSAGTAKAEDLTQTPQEKPSEGKEDQTDETSEDDLKDANMPANPHPTINEATAPEIPMSKMSLRDGHDADVRMDDCESIPAGQLIERGPTNGTSSGDVFYIDIKGSQQPVHTGLPLPRVRRSRSPAASDSSEEIILFAGRNTSQVRTHTKLDPLQESANMPGDVLQQPSESLQGSPRFTTSLVDNFLNLAASPDPPVAKSSLGRRVKAGVTLAPAPSHHVAEMEESLSKRGGRTREKRLRKSVEEAEILNDYIANAHDSEDLEHFAENSGLNRRNLGGSDGDQWVNEEDVSATEPEQNTLEHLVDEWDSADLCDFDEISTSSEAPDAVDHILSKRNRLSGVQYLVVGVGFTRDDARWLPVSMLPTPDAIKEIRNFEEGQAEIERLFRSGDSSDNSLTIDERLISDLREDLDGLEDEQDLEERMKERMTDEQIARLLTKQEELGLGSSDLVLFNGDDLPDNHVEEAQTDGALGRPPASFQLQPRSKRSKSHQPSFPSATAFADVLDQDPYNGFDVMDQERPSLRKRSKGRRGKLDLELSDSDLEQTITAASETDRTKKKIRKQEREELRAQGLLGKKGKVDMKAKYSEGMSMDQVKAEIRDFLLSSMDRYAHLACYVKYYLTLAAFPCHQWLRKNAKSSTRLPMSSR